MSSIQYTHEKKSQNFQIIKNGPQIFSINCIEMISSDIRKNAQKILKIEKNYWQSIDVTEQWLCFKHWAQGPNILHE